MARTLAIFPPLTNAPPTSNYATIDLRNNHVVLDFDDTVDESAVFTSIVPRHYANSNIKVVLIWSAVPTTGNVVWLAAFERNESGTHDIDADAFAGTLTSTSTTAGTSGVLVYTEIEFTQAQADGVVSGDRFRLKVTRDADSGSDTMVGDAELIGIEVFEL
jgi:hypothetical protein